MKTLVLSLVTLLGVLAFGAEADARPNRGGEEGYSRQMSQHRAHRGHRVSKVHKKVKRSRYARTHRSTRGSRVANYRARSGGEGIRTSFFEGSTSGVGPRPRAWCGWWMRTQLGGGPQYNLAWNWRNYGSPGSPQVGAVVVWRHHVGMITGQASNGQWLVKSGNDSRRVRERPRSIAGAVIRI